MMRNVVKLMSVASATVFLAGCFNASSPNYAAKVSVAQPASQMPAKEYVLSGDFLFDFDKSNLSDQGKTTLDRVAQELKETGATQVTVTGYTDRLGSANYNLKLSQSRANTAKAYLHAQGVTADIKALGRGKANQVKACHGVHGQALKDCLKPNRRVVIQAQ